MTIVADSETPTTGEVALATVKAKAFNEYKPKVGDTVAHLEADTAYMNPIIRVVSEDEVETGIPAITIYTKRDTYVEPEREAGKKQTSFYADKHFVVALTNSSEVVLLLTNV